MVKFYDQYRFSKKFLEIIKIIESKQLFGEEYCSIYIPSINKVELVNNRDLEREIPQLSKPRVLYSLALANTHKMMEEGIFLSSVGTSLIPLPHQIACLSRVITEGKSRYLIADEVGLGKTIEAGLIFKELKLRGYVEKILVLCPKSLVMQWVSEMKLHFNEEFTPILSDQISKSQNFFSEINFWKIFPYAVCSFDSVKPLLKRQGWTKKKIEDYNRYRFENLISSGWDLVIIDEAHKVAGSTEGVARNKLAKELSKAIPYLILLTATPHQGKRDGFLRLMRLLDEDQFPNENSLTLETISNYTIRTEKRNAINIDGKQLFKERKTLLVTFEEKSLQQEELHRAVEDYVRTGYRTTSGTYMILYLMVLQRILSSSTKALLRTLKRRVSYLLSGEQSKITEDEESFGELEWKDKPILIDENEIDILKDLILLAEDCIVESIDSKAKELIDIIYHERRVEENPTLKFLIFTEFIATQEMLKEFLSLRGLIVVTLNGQNSLEERIESQNHFRNDAEILISTDAGGEGINLQFCHVVINYDLPWNPMRLEQRIGRVDRIGQKLIVKAYNLVKKGSIDEYIQKLLEDKLALILKDFGIDKVSDILDSKISNNIFNKVYCESLINPTKIPKLLQEIMKDLEEIASERVKISKLMALTLEIDAKEKNAQRTLNFEKNLELTIISYLNSFGGKAKRSIKGWNIIWPDGSFSEEVSFNSEECALNGFENISITHPWIKKIIALSPTRTVLESKPLILIKDFSLNINGTWSLWYLKLSTTDKIIKKYIPIYIDKKKQFFIPSSNRIWEKLLDGNFEIKADTPSFNDHYLIHKTIAENRSKDLFYESQKKVRSNRELEYHKKMAMFEAKEKAIKRIGIENIKKRRLNDLNQLKQRIRNTFSKTIEIIPELYPILFMEVKGCE